MELTEKNIRKFFATASIQKHLTDLCSKNIDVCRRAADQLVGFYKMNNSREDCIIALIGFLHYRIKNSKQVMYIFNIFQFLQNFEIMKHLLTVICKDKEITKQRIFLNSFSSYLTINLYGLPEEDKLEIESIIDNSVWGVKSKKNYLDLFHRDDDYY